MQNQTITDLITQRKSVSLVAMHRETTAQLWARHRDYYLQALASGAISLLCSLAKEGDQDGPRRCWQATFKDQALIVSVTPDNLLSVTYGGNVICSNEEPGSEFIIPDEWLVYCLEALTQIETNRRERARLAEAERQHKQQQKALNDHQQSVQIFSVLEA